MNMIWRSGKVRLVLMWGARAACLGFCFGGGAKGLASAHIML